MRSEAFLFDSASIFDIRMRDYSAFTVWERFHARKSEITNQIDVNLDLLGINSNELIIYALTCHPELNTLSLLIRILYLSEL